MLQRAEQEQPQTFQDCGGLRLTVAQYDSHTVIFSIAASTWSYNSLVPGVLLVLALLVGYLLACQNCHSLTGSALDVRIAFSLTTSMRLSCCCMCIAGLCLSASIQSLPGAGHPLAVTISACAPLNKCPHCDRTGCIVAH